MGTPANIVALHSSGRWGVSYINYDGYVEGVGMTLFEFYADQNRVDALLELGHLSSLGQTLDPKHTESYARDRDEEDVDTDYYDTYAQALAEAHDHPGQYLYAWEGHYWHYKGRPVPEAVDEDS